jgi:MtN3 and saliva related transmembrane protein
MRSTIMEAYLPWIGGLAALLTSLSYFPQVRKAWPTGATDDLSLHMLIVLTAGLCFWIVYGILKSDGVIILANCVGALLSGCVLAFKIRDTSERIDRSFTVSFSGFLNDNLWRAIAARQRPLRVLRTQGNHL